MLKKKKKKDQSWDSDSGRLSPEPIPFFPLLCSYSCECEMLSACKAKPRRFSGKVGGERASLSRKACWKEKWGAGTPAGQSFCGNGKWHLPTPGKWAQGSRL